MRSDNIDRRTLLQAIASAGLLFTVSSGSAVADDDDGGTAAESETLGLDLEEYDIELNLRAAPGSASILPGTPSEVWRYTAEVLKGPETTVSENTGSYLGPTIRLRRGQTVKVNIYNELAEDTTVHWHGLHVPSDVDGQPRLPIQPGETMTVGFEVRDRAGLYWYHSHAHGEQGGRVGFQSYAGLAGLLIIEDDEEDSIGLPSGDNELLLVLQDRSFAGANELVYLGGGMGAMMDRMGGFLGDRVLVNGVPPTTREVATRLYRIRVLNGSNARIYKLAWSDGRPVTVIGSDSGLMQKPENKPFAVLAPAQRLDILVDLSRASPGSTLELISDNYDADMMGGGMMGGSDMPAGSRFSLMTLNVTESVDSAESVPAQFPLSRQSLPVSSSTRVRQFLLSQAMMRGFAINGRRFDGTNVANGEIVRVGDTEIWEFRNDTHMPHPMHVHGLQFNIRERSAGGNAGGWNELQSGLVDGGWHDTVLVLPDETVQVVMKFERFTGLYMLHCHNMEHEDMGMMRYFRIEG